MPQPTKRKVWPWVAGGVVAIVLVCCRSRRPRRQKGQANARCTVRSIFCTAAPNHAPNRASTAQTNCRPGRLSRYAMASLSFKVVDIERVETVSDETGDHYGIVIAQGEFVVVTLSIENTGDQARRFYGGRIRSIVDTSGREFSFSSMIDYKLDAASRRH